MADAFESGRLLACTPFLLEAGYSARNTADHASLMADLRSLPFAPIDPEVEERVVVAQGALARTGHHRIPPVDLLVAAIADRHGHGIVHYDADYDLIAKRTSLRFESIWLAKKGAL